MADLAAAEFDERLRLKRQFSESTAKSLATVPNKSMALMSLAGDYASIAVHSLLKRQREDARKAFALEGASLLELVAVEPRTVPCGARKSALECALLSGNGELESRCLAVGLPAACPDLGNLVEPYARALFALASKNVEEARRCAVQLSQIPAEEILKRKFYPHLGEIVSSILDKDDSALRKGLESLLERHGQFSRKGQYRRSEAGLLCMPAAALSALALRYGLHPAADDRVRKIKLTFGVSALETWEGGPTRGLTFEIIADVLPIDLLA
jgi:hypothetical protein